MSNKVWPWVAVVVLAVSGFGLYTYDQNKVTCADVSVAFTAETRNNPNQLTGYKAVTVKGVNGTDQVCTSKAKFVSKERTVAPIVEITEVGTKKPAPVVTTTYTDQAPVQTAQQCEVTLCNDGSCSYSQGRGTCSYHGGVDTYY